MSQFVAPPARPPSRALVIVGSLLIAFHLAAVGVNVLAATSGPWLSYDNNNAPPPRFAFVVNQVTGPTYLNLLKMTHNYHFATNRPGVPGVYFTARLKDAEGKEIATVRVPDPKANPWVRHRELLLAQGLTEDQPIPPPQGEEVPAPGQAMKTVKIWDMAPDKTLRITEVQEVLVPRGRPVLKPSEWSELLARAYARRLCRVHGAASAEIVRHTREAVTPAAMFLGSVPPASSDDLIANFGELPR